MSNSLAQARKLDQCDPLRTFRDKFCFPRNTDGTQQLYFCGNSLGLQPKNLSAEMLMTLENWQEMGVEGHFTGSNPWTLYPQRLQRPMAELAGARYPEVVIMNSLTVNLHLLMVSFYQPRGQRNRILVEPQPFPSDRYALESQIRLHGLDPNECLVELPADEDGHCINESSIEAYLAEHGDSVALVLWPGVQYVTGQSFDLQRIAAAAHKAGARCGFDLAHAIGNIPLALHDSNADFAVWCTYKYLNSGPGAVAACFIHERHLGRSDLPRLHGWWGTDLDSRFLMGPDFIPATGADAWQASNPPILAMIPIGVSLEIFQQAGMRALRDKSITLTTYFEHLIQRELDGLLEIITPPAPGRRGCQLSLKVRAGRGAGRTLYQQLIASGTVPDWREPDVIRVAPVPLYNSFEDCWRFVDQVKRLQDNIP